jgi:methionyl-tRNA formyltransferase
MTSKNKVLFCGYRDWAKKIIKELKESDSYIFIDQIDSKEEFNEKIKYFLHDIDMVIFIGWSWIIPKEITSSVLCIGIHPSDLPQFRGGSPIQHQIIKGLKHSKVSLMTLSQDKLDAGDIWAKNDFSLEGENMGVIFNNIVISSVQMLSEFLTKYPNIKPEKQDLNKGSYFKRRKPEESKIMQAELSKIPLEDLYNKIRCLTDPYPNVYIEDEYGNRLYIDGVKFKPTKIN